MSPIKYHKKFFDRIGIHLGFKKMEDWYKITQEDIHKHGGAQILVDYYKNSPSKALKVIYPQHNWDLWRFKKVPHGYMKTLMDDVNEQKRVINWLSDQLRVQSLDDWYRISLAQIQRHILIKSWDIVTQFLKTSYPQLEHGQENCALVFLNASFSVHMSLQQRENHRYNTPLLPNCSP